SYATGVILYFVFIFRSTGCVQYDVIHPIQTLINEMDQNQETTTDEHVFKRLNSGLYYNAFNYIESIVVFAPTFYPTLWENSSYTTQVGGFGGSLLGHEIFHSFVSHDISEKSTIFKHESDCLMNHMRSSCDKWAESGCSSGSF
ncbi:hypothetical protein PMAYCL1PPCAC_19037, partial [Pristionchus mayeri]